MSERYIPCACTEIPFYVAYRCSKCNALNVYCDSCFASERYCYTDEMQEARRKANENAEKKVAELTVLENIRKGGRFFCYHTCKKCKNREPWSEPKVLEMPNLCMVGLTIMSHLIIPSVWVFLWSLFNFPMTRETRDRPDYRFLILGILLALIIGSLLLFYGRLEVANQKIAKLDDINLPHVALDKEGLLQCLQAVDQQNEYGNLDDFETTLYADRKEYYRYEDRARERR